MSPAQCIASLLAVLMLSVSHPVLAVLPFSNTGDLYVSMWSSDEIAVFHRDGTPAGRFTVDGLDGPRGLAFHPVSGELWVAGEFSNALYVFDNENRLLRTVEHADFNEPVGITFSTSPDAAGAFEVYVSNSNNNEVMVLDESGALLRRFSDPSLRDPNCAAFFPDGTLYLTNRLGGSEQSGGALARFNAEDLFEFDFSTEGLVSTMAAARDPNRFDDPLDDTLWVTSGAGTRGIHEFDVSGNLLGSILPGDIAGGSSLVPQGIAFADDGHFFVVSFNNAVFEFDGDGMFLSRFPTGPGTSRSTAFRPCDASCAESEATSETAVPAGDPLQAMDANNAPGSSSGGGGGLAVWLLLPLVFVKRFVRVNSSLWPTEVRRKHRS